MRTLRIDFTNTAVSYPEGALAGRKGEHLMTQLALSLPEELTGAEIEYHRIAFCRYGKEERILTNRITETESGDRAYRVGNTIYCKLWHDITSAQGLFFNVEGCQEQNGEETLLCKSLRGRLHFQSAVTGEEGFADTPHSSPRDGITPHIGENGNWFTGTQDMGVSAAGQTGAAGPKGDPGAPGLPGVTPHIDSATRHWMVGETDTGIPAEGMPGPHGTDGADGVSPTVAVASNTAAEYKLTITDKNGAITTPNLKGQDGAGSGSVSVTVGETVTGAPGTNAAVTNAGTASAPILRFTIPRGNPGAQGPAGAQGDTPVRGTDYWTADDVAAINAQISTAVAGKQDQPEQVTSGTNIALADNTEYRLAAVSSLTLAYPAGNFECWLSITTIATGAVTVTFPSSTRYIGTPPIFANGEVWELSIKDGIVIAAKAV